MGQAYVADTDGYIDTGPAEPYRRAAGDLHAGSTDPASLKEMLARENGDLWRKAVSEEYDSLIEQTMPPFEGRPKYCKVVGSKRVFRKKTDAQGFIQHYTPCFVAKRLSKSQEGRHDQVRQGTPQGCKAGIYRRYLMGAAVRWASQREKNTTLSSNEVERMATCRATQEIVVLMHLLRTLNV